MKDYDLIVDKLLKKYKLYEKINLNTVGIYKEKLNKITKRDKKYILFGNIQAIDIWVHYFKIKSLVNIKYVILSKNLECYSKIHNIEVKSINEISNLETYEILDCNNYEFDKRDNILEKELEKQKVIVLNDKIPPYARGLYYIFSGNSTQYYLEKKKEIVTEIQKEINKFNDRINCKVRECCEGFSTVIWGGGIHTESLLQNTNILDRLNVKYIIDKNIKLQGKNINGIKIGGIENLENIKFDAILISSVAYRKEIEKEIRIRFADKVLIDIYEDEKLYKYITNGNFATYINKGIVQEKTIYKEIIVKALAIRDFYTANKYIDKYINQMIPGYEHYRDFKIELNEVLEEIKVQIKNKKTQNIHFIIIDALDKYSFDKYTYFLRKLSQMYVSYENAFTASTYTTESHLCMFLGENLFDNNTFVRKSIKSEESYITRYLKKKDYKIVGNNVRVIAEELFDIIIGEKNEKKPISKMIWENICYYILEDRQKQFIYYRPMEYHDVWENEKVKALEYIDKQMEYYYDFINEKDLILITSDHGKAQFDGDEGRIKIPFIIRNTVDENLKIKGLFSSKDIGKVIISQVEGENKYYSNNKYVVIERTPIYNEASKRSFENIGAEKYINAFRIIRTSDEKYILFEDGKEEDYKIAESGEILRLKDEFKLNELRMLAKRKSFPKFNLKERAL